MEHNLAEARQLRLQLPPEPRTHVLDRRHLKTRNVIHIAVIQLRQQWLHRPRNPRVIVHPADRRIHFPLHRYLKPETMPMHHPALVALRQRRQRLRRFEGELLDNPCPHKLPGFSQPRPRALPSAPQGRPQRSDANPALPPA